MSAAVITTDDALVLRNLNNCEVTDQPQSPLRPRPCELCDIEQEEFSKTIKREYAKTAIAEIAKNSGYDIEYEENEATGNIEMVVTQW